MELSGWGQFPKIDGQLSTPRSQDALAQLVAAQTAQAPVTPRGMGRAYGDAAIGTQTISMRGFNRMISFDEDTGQLVAQSGVTLAEIIDAFLPRGWFLAVTPGTKFVSIGGAIAADVHGKNHHVDGSFGSFVDWLDLMGADGIVRRCSPEENADLFAWTIGGMGLTGIILRAAIRLKPVTSGWIRQRNIAAASLEAAIETFEANMDATYSMAWIDCLASGDALGRSLVTLGEHASRDELPADRRAAPFETPPRKAPSVPFNLPGFLLNPLSMRAFNALYYQRGLNAPSTTLVGWDSFFYPLDAVGNWNRVYGRKGFMQFQCVLPQDTSPAGLRSILRATSSSGSASFLAVLKRFGPQESRLSFPMAGYTLALDFPNTKRSQSLLPVLDRIVTDHGGRFYLAKDSRMSPQTLHSTDPRWHDFAQMRVQTGLATRFASAQSERLGL